ncbi:hypothetical protein PC111_g23139 [Phytophthora cactorum]|nr:hypothetical protein PC111_g23139 [Phytophthora cactorum]
MSPSNVDTIDKLVEDNYFHQEFNMRVKLARKGPLPQIIKPEFDQVSDRSTAEWKTNDLKALGVISGDGSLTYQVYFRGALSAAEAWTQLEEHINRKMLKNRLLIAKKLHSFQMEPRMKFVAHVDKFKELVLQMESIEYRMLATALENTLGLIVIGSREGVRYEERKDFGNKRRFNGKYFYCKKLGHKEFECRKKKADEGRGQVTQAQSSDFAFTTASSMAKSEWLVDSGASSHMTSARDKFVSMRDLRTPVRITIADGTKIDAVATGTVGL